MLLLFSMPRLVENCIENPLVFEELEELLVDSDGWNQVMKIGGVDVKSKKIGCFYGVPDDYGSLPYFRCPSFEEAIAMPDWLKAKLLDVINTRFGESFNLVKVQKYVNGKSGIERHSDKGLDMNKETPIFIYRINKDPLNTRSLIFRHKVTGEEESFDMPSNSLLAISVEENKSLVHYVPKTEDDGTDECISFVFRKIDTYMHPETKIKYGIGAKYGTYEGRAASCEEPIDMLNPRISADIVHMYRFENTHDLTVNDPAALYDAVRINTV